eukprot:scaffold75402_cov68-Phaeocystis_antarctica.AAC.4
MAAGCGLKSSAAAAVWKTRRGFRRLGAWRVRWLRGQRGPGVCWHGDKVFCSATYSGELQLSLECNWYTGGAIRYRRKIGQSWTLAPTNTRVGAVQCEPGAARDRHRQRMGHGRGARPDVGRGAPRQHPGAVAARVGYGEDLDAPQPPRGPPCVLLPAGGTARRAVCRDAGDTGRALLAVGRRRVESTGTGRPSRACTVIGVVVITFYYAYGANPCGSGIVLLLLVPDTARGATLSSFLPQQT